MDRLFDATHCDRCGKVLGARITRQGTLSLLRLGIEKIALNAGKS